MLDELAVANLGLIVEARVEPGPGLVAVTGETGAGKTLLLGALRLLRGDPARRDRVGPAGEEARVEGRFLLDGKELVAARRLGGDASKAYLDGSMVPRRVLEDRLQGMVEIVAQHEHMALGREAALRTILDGLLDEAGRTARDTYREAWERWRRLQADRDAIGGDRRALERERDLALHQAREVAGAHLVPGEDGALAADLQRLQHAAEIATVLGSARASLSDDGGVGDRFGEIVAAIRRIAGFDPSVAPLAERAAALAAETDDLTAELRHRREDLEEDPARLEATRVRLAALSDLKRKYGETLEEVAAFGVAAAARAEQLADLLSRAESLSIELAVAAEAVESSGAVLTGARLAAARRLARAAGRHLRDLGFGSPVVEMRVTGGPPGPTGTDRVELLFASDRALEPGPVGKVASGGELSRLVLAVHLAAGVGQAPVVAFDEIDAGIGGTTALAMGEKLAALAAGRQVLVVTHLPQVAAFADTHLVVERQGTRASVRRVDGEERVQELTRMLGGLPASERGREHASELLEAAANRRGKEASPGT